MKKMLLMVSTKREVGTVSVDIPPGATDIILGEALGDAIRNIQESDPEATMEEIVAMVRFA